MLSHLEVKGDSSKAAAIRKIRLSGGDPRISILMHGLPNDETACIVEAAVIDVLGLHQLTNLVRGHGSAQRGRMSLRQLLAFYRAKPVVVTHPAILVRINRLYRHDMSPEELYEATRGVWDLSRKRAETARYALAVYEGIVREVYDIREWRAAGSTRYETRPMSEVRIKGRIEFLGALSGNSIRSRYIDHSVRKYLPRGLQSPVVYVNC